ncbi:MAG: Holliday junction resolvase RuvX [Actinomycetales bacterium]|nr:Holliday junction resolvase RuvX [Actinomycetales bacterium]
MRPGVRIALDVGTVRIGVARSDALGMLAVPLDAVAAGDTSIDAVLAVADEWQAIEAYVGLPLHMSGGEGASAEMARSWAGRLAERSDMPVRLIDERLSTVQAQRALREGGRSTRQSRSVIDSASAVMVLQSVLDAESATGRAPGELVERRETT